MTDRIRMSIKGNRLFFALVLTISACSNDQLAVVSEEQVLVFEKEVDAAYEGSQNRESIKPIATIQKGGVVLILKDSYGKDYWACKVALNNNITGWILCTSLKF